MSYHGSYLPNALLHIDADAFFASCEQAVNPAYRGKPVITGAERGIVAAASYEAKKLGIKRGVSLRDVRKICPDAIILPSNYETYSLFSKRMFDIIRRTTSAVEEYSIDEAFADITGLRRPMKMSYSDIAKHIQTNIHNDLGITVSVGLASTKVLGKVAANWNKPNGFAAITSQNKEQYLAKLDVEEIWGIGRQTAKHLYRLGITTALQFAQRPENWVKNNFTKPHQEIWQELNGHSVYKIETAEKESYASISKTRTFTPSSANAEFVFAQLAKNVENAFIKVRRHQLVAKKIIVYLKTQQYRYLGLEAKLNRPTAFTHEILPLVRQLFKQLFVTNTQYRATGAVLCGLQTDESIQMSLFENPLELDKLKKVYSSIDKLSNKYGKHTIFLGSSMPAHTVSQHQNFRGSVPIAKQLRSKALNQRKFMNLPVLLGSVK
ncbi:MAG: DNA polymerase IV [bacterium]|nr:DNA polymerase IV [bacterium]